MDDIRARPRGDTAMRGAALRPTQDDASFDSRSSTLGSGRKRAAVVFNPVRVALADDPDVVIAAGGDGTVHAVAEVMQGTGIAMALDAEMAENTSAATKVRLGWFDSRSRASRTAR